MNGKNKIRIREQNMKPKRKEWKALDGAGTFNELVDNQVLEWFYDQK